MRPVTEEEFEEWKQNPVTVKLFKVLKNEREGMKEGLIYDTFENPEEVKGRCRAIAQLLDLSYEDLYDDRK